MTERKETTPPFPGAAPSARRDEARRDFARRGCAFFDVDGTLLRGNIVSYYVHLRTCRDRPLRRALWTLGFALTVPYWIALDKRSRSDFQRAFYRNYRSFAPAELEARAQVHFERHMLPRIFPGALARLREHRERGDLVVLVTGSLHAIVEPLARHVQADALLAPHLRQVGGRLTGELEGPPLAAERKADAATEFARQHGLDAARCWVYADSLDDLPFLRRAGHAVVVNARGALRRIAAREGWQTLDWSPACKPSST